MSRQNTPGQLKAHLILDGPISLMVSAVIIPLPMILSSNMQPGCLPCHPPKAYCCNHFKRPTPKRPKAASAAPHVRANYSAAVNFAVILSHVKVPERVGVLREVCPGSPGQGERRPSPQVAPELPRLHSGRTSSEGTASSARQRFLLLFIDWKRRYQLFTFYPGRVLCSSGQVVFPQRD